MVFTNSKAMKSKLKILAIFVCSAFVFSAFAQKGEIQFTSADLKGESSACLAAKSSKPELENCDLNEGDISSLVKTGNLQNEYLMGKTLTEELRLNYIRQARLSLQSQYQAITWLTDQNPLETPITGSRLRDTIGKSGGRCGSTDEFSYGQYTVMSDEIKSITPQTAVQKLGLGKVPKSHLDSAKEQILKRTLIAWLEIHRIGKQLADSVVTVDERKKLEIRRAKIRQAYPVIANFPYAASLAQLVEFGYPNVSSPLRGDSHPQIDAVLFPDSEKGYAPIAPGQTQGGNEGLVNSILKNSVPKKIKDEMAKAMGASLTASFKSVGDLCGLEPCQILNLDLETTSRTLNQISISKKDFQQDAAFRAACSCGLRENTEYVSGGAQLAMVGAAIGGIVLCPFTFGVGCYVSAASGAALTASAAANTIGAAQDSADLAPLAKTIASLPGLTDKQRSEIIAEAESANKRMALGAVETAMGLSAVGPVSRAGRDILSAKEAFRPIARSATSSGRLLKRAEKERETLQAMGVEFQKHNEMTLVESDVKLFQRDVKYVNDTGEDYYGELLRITKLPKPDTKGTTSTLALRHPSMQAEIDRLKKMGIDVVVDTSLKETGSGAYYWGKTRVIAISPETTWQTFRHEVQHADFARFVEPNFRRIQENVLVRGGSVSDLIQPGRVTGYTPKELKRLDDLIRRDHVRRGINESMSTSRELDEMGWKKYIPFYGTNPISYGARHRVDSLMELQDQGYELTAMQRQELAKGKAVLVMAKVYEIGAPAVTAYGVAKGGMAVGEKIAEDVLSDVRSSAPPYVVIEKKGDSYEASEASATYYNEKTGDMIIVAPDGTLLSPPPLPIP